MVVSPPRLESQPAGGSAGLAVIAPGVAPLSRNAYARIKAEAGINGSIVSRGTGANALGGPELVLTWLANDLIASGLYLRAGDVVTTGVITEVFRTKLGDEIFASFEQIGSVAARL